jgi:hypothetical protein
MAQVANPEAACRAVYCFGLVELARIPCDVYLNRMVPSPKNAERPMVEVALPSGCPLCGGEIALRITSRSAWSWCPFCRWLANPIIRTEGKRLRVEYLAVATA